MSIRSFFNGVLFKPLLSSLRVLEAIHLFSLFWIDCRAALAMTSPAGTLGRGSSILSLIFLLSSCAQVPKYSPSTLSWEQRQQQLSTLINWQFRGDILLKMPQHKLSANIYWQQELQAYHILFFGPFGVGAVSLDGKPGDVHLSDSHNNDYSARSPEALMQEQLGWSLPVSSLYYWVRGLPAPGSITSVHYDAYHRMDMLEQQGWQIHYVAYQRAQGLELPQEITFTQDKFFMNLTIETGSWQIKTLVNSAADYT